MYVTDKARLLCAHQEAVTDYISIIRPCNHEKADMRVIIIVFDSARKGSQKLLIRTVDTDILVLEIAYAEIIIIITLIIIIIITLFRH